MQFQTLTATAAASLLSLSAMGEEMKWTPVGLDAELHPIAHLESSFGKNMNHEPHSKGPFFSSYGAVGLKGVTAYEAYMRSAYLKKVFPGFANKDLFMEEFTVSPAFYNACANQHWYYVKRNTESIEQAVFAWRWGLGAALKAALDEIKADRYVSAYVSRATRGQK